MDIDKVNLFADVKAHLDNRTAPDLFKAAVVEPARNIITRTIRERTRSSQQITGESMPPLGRSYSAKKKKMTGAARPDLRYGFDKQNRRKAKALDSIHTQTQTKGKGGFDVGYYFSGSADDTKLTAAEYMSVHQTGKKKATARTPSDGKRKWFPTEDKAETAGLVVLEKEIEKLISAHMNKGAISRTIKIG